MPVTCPVCGRPVPALIGRGRPRVSCSPACAKIRQQSQLDAAHAKRTSTLGPRSCGVCGATYQPRRANARYCSDPCRVAGLLRAIQDQRRLREAARKERGQC